jgi:N-acetylglucosaminyl-diphospho-decaprenol L-rhamnosyltransferase
MNVRNGAPYLREALDSVLAQTFDDWELVVWDDCSTDDSARIVAEYSDRRIRYFLSSEDTPLGPARNFAIQQARGEWLAFLDQDDVWLPDKLSSQLELADSDASSRVGMIYGRTVEFFPDGRERDFDSHHEFSRLPEGNVFNDFFRCSCFVAMSSAMIRRSAFDRIGPIPSQMALISDFYIFISLAYSYEIRAVEHTVCRYRRHPTSLSRSSRFAIHEEALVLLQTWAGRLAPVVEREARKGYQTQLALSEMVRPGSLMSGLIRLLLKGSVGYVLARPFARVTRSIRQRLGRPRWKFPVDQPRHAPSVPSRGARASSHPSLAVSIIVVSWNVRDLLRDCLNSIYARMCLPAGSWELIVVENNSRDGSAEMVRREFPGAVLIANSENTGFARANNQAFQDCRGRYIFLLNPDVVLLDSAIDRMLDIIEVRPDVAALGCRLLNPDLSLQRWTAGAAPGLLNLICHYLFLNRLLPSRILPQSLFLEQEPGNDAEVGWVSGACMLLRREALGDRIFDERFFMYGEDLHLCQSLIKTGWKVVYTPRVQLIHYGGRSLDSQTPEVQVHRLSNLRQVFGIRNGPASLVYFDSVVSVAFLLRSVAFAVAAKAFPGKGYEIRAAKSRRYLAEAVRGFGSR